MVYIIMLSEKGNNMTQFKNVADFHNKFGLSYNGKPTFLEPEEQKFRIKCLYEELREYEQAVADEDLPEQFDALVDLVYFALGTAHRQGFPWSHYFDRVHQANMSKSQEARKQRRGWNMEITKPEGWQSPDATDLLENYRLMSEIKEGYTGLITVDGVDGSGKTTLAKRIAEMFGGEHIHLTWSPAIEEVMDSYRCSAIQYASALAKDKIVVLERAWLSHPIYSNAYRGGDMHDFQKWKRATERNQILGIIALPHDDIKWLEQFKRSTETREELYTDTDKMIDVYNMFQACYNGVNTMRGKYPDLPMLDKSRYVRYDYQSVNPVSDLDSWILETFNARAIPSE